MTDQESMRSLDEIMSREPATETVQEPNPPANPSTEQQGQARDETGKFAPKPANGDGAGDGATDHAAQAAVEGGKPEKGTVPLPALQAARDKARTEGERAAELERQLAELRGQVSVLTQQRQPQPQPTEKPKPKSFWESPDEFLAERLAPVQQTMQQQRIEMSTMFAVQQHGQAAVDEARAALAEAIQANPQDPSLIALDRTSGASPHPMNDLVTWHQRRKAMADIGDDPVSYRERLRQELLAELQSANPAPATSQPQPAAKTPLPTNFAAARSEGPRSAVTYSGPKPLSEIAKGSAQ